MKKSLISMFLVAVALMLSLSNSVQAGDFGGYDYSLRPTKTDPVTENTQVEIFQFQNISPFSLKPSVGFIRKPSISFDGGTTFGGLNSPLSGIRDHYPGITKQPVVSFLLSDGGGSDGNVHKILKNLPFIPSASLSSRNGFNSGGIAIWFDDDGKEFGKILFFGQLRFWGY